VSPLKAKILHRIESEGPIGVAEYMRIALTDPEHGYYMRKDPLGAGGDFTTAPEISQMFGEILGLFFVQAWEDRGSPPRFHFVELGPGRGTLMADMLRTAKVRPNFLAAAEVTLIEASPALRAIQEQALKGTRARWAQGLDHLDGAPLFLVANEFLDALPARQMVRFKGGWHERMIAAESGELRFALSDEAVPPEAIPARFRDAPESSIFELGAEAIACVRQVANRIARWGGVALFIDYGHAQPAPGDTFQAVKAHRYADPLAEPGEADLTFHVDFAGLAREALKAGARPSGPIAQGEFLRNLGIEARAERLKRSSPQSAADIDAALARLTDPAQMGELFKVLAISDTHSPALPGFSC
jgi:NADH dehydrogenase [ubiquinone] 1 alpha subcomplex assembly factor 7